MIDYSKTNSKRQSSTRRMKQDALTLALSMFGLAFAIIVIAILVVINLKV